MYGPKWPFLLRYGSCYTRCIDFPRIDELSTDPRVLGRHSSDVVTTYALVYFLEYVVGVFLSYALKNGRREASLIKGSLVNGEPCRPRPKLGRLLWVAWQFTIYQVIPDGVHPARFGHHRGDFSVIDA